MKEAFVALIQKAKWKNSETPKNSCGIWVRLICLLPPIHYLEPHGHLFTQKNLRFNFGSYHKILFDWFFCREEGWTLMNLHILHQKKRNFANHPVFENRLDLGPPISRLRTKCTWEHSWEQKNKYDWSHYQQYFRNISLFFLDMAKKNAVSVPRRLWLSYFLVFGELSFVAKLNGNLSKGQTCCAEFSPPLFLPISLRKKRMGFACRDSIRPGVKI